MSLMSWFHEFPAPVKRISPVTFAVLASMFLSVIALIDDPVLNRDGMLYVDIARDIVANGIEAAGRYEWPFISLFIAGPALLLGIDPLIVANAFSVLAMMLVSFLVVRMAGETSPSFAWYAVVFVLCAPVFNDYRADLIRGMGGWALILGSLYCLLRWHRAQRWQYSAGFQLCMGGAFLFRPELVVIGAAGGLWLVLGSIREQRVATFFGLFGPLAALGLALVALPLVLDLQIGERVAKLQGITNLSQRIDEFENKADAVADVALNDYIADEAGQVLFVGMASLLVSKWMALLGVFVVPFFFSVVRRVEVSYRGFFAFSAICFSLTLLLYLFWSYLLSSRYVAPLAMLSLPWVCEGMQYLDQRYLSSRSRLAVILVAALLALSGVISTSAGKGYLKEAGHWVGSRHAPGEKVYFNDQQVRFYAGFGYPRYGIEESLDEVLRELPYWSVLVLHVESESFSKKLEERLSGSGFSRVKRFSNEEGKDVLILDRSRQGAGS